jgi:hypothetical protein
MKQTTSSTSGLSAGRQQPSLVVWAAPPVATATMQEAPSVYSDTANSAMSIHAQVKTANQPSGDPRWLGSSPSLGWRGRRPGEGLATETAVLQFS